MDPLASVWQLPLSDEEKVRVNQFLLERRDAGKDVSAYFLAPTPELVAWALKHGLEQHEKEGKRRVESLSFAQEATGRATKRQRAIEQYRPTYVPSSDILGSQVAVPVDLKWLFLLVDVGQKVDVGALTQERRKNRQAVAEWARNGKGKRRPFVKEKYYYDGVLAFLKAAALGQKGLHFGGEGGRPDIQGFIEGRMVKCPADVKPVVSCATDRDPHGAHSNAVDIKQVADYLKSGSDDAVSLGCLFCRMDRFWVLKYERATNTVKVTPHFPRAQHPSAQNSLSDPPDFVLLNIRRIDDLQEGEKMSAALPTNPSAGFAMLVAFVEQLQILHSLPRTEVRLISHCGAEVPIADLKTIAHGRKSVVMLRRSTSTVVKIFLSAAASLEKKIHLESHGHPNLRTLVGWGQVDVGCQKGVFHYLELEGYGQPFSGVHVSTLEKTEEMWRQAYAGLQHLHDKRILHRDLKPDNLVVFEGVLKINDYDVSCSRDDPRAYNEVVGTLGFQSPSGNLPYREEDDVLSLGLTFYSARMDTLPPESRRERFRILKDQLHPSIFPEALRVAVHEALDRLGLHQVPDDLDEDDERLRE